MKPVLPGATLGVLGSGQLGRMFSIAARRMGYRVHTLSPEYDTPTGQVADQEITAAYTDLDAVRKFAQGVDVVTFEFENVLAATTSEVEKWTPVRPSGRVLHVTQNRLREKKFLRSIGLPVPDFHEVDSLESLRGGIDALGLPVVLKTAGWGYDGKGQRIIKSADQVDAAWQSLGAESAIVETLVPLACEVSVVVGRGLDGTVAIYDLFRNRHANHILDVTSSPAGLGPVATAAALEIARVTVEALEVVGVLCVELFVLSDGTIMVNELAPRPHNSGHLTIEAHVTSQFEQQLRAVCGLPLGDVDQFQPAAMANLLGDLWSDGDPDFARMSSLSEVKLHLYGKSEARAGRKMGHLTTLAGTTQVAVDRVRLGRRCLNEATRVATGHA